MLIKNKNTIFILIDNVQDTELKDNLLSYTLFRRMIFGFPCEVVPMDQLDICITDIANRYDLGIFVCAGTHIDNFVPDLEQIDFDTTPLVAHLLEHSGDLSFHPQFFVLDLSVYKTLNCPGLAPTQQKDFVYNNYQRTEQNVHDDYTPLEIAPGDVCTKDCVDLEFGGNLAHKLLNAGYSLSNVNDAIRSKKIYLYHEFNGELIKQMTQRLDIELPDDPGQNCLRDFRQELGYQVNFSNVFYPVNTENMDTANNFDVVDYFVGVSSGLLPIGMFKYENFQSCKKFTLIDMSDASIDWQQYIRQHWNGDVAQLSGLLQDFLGASPHYSSVSQNFQNDLDEFLSINNIQANQMQQYWQHYQSCEVEFLKLDLLDNNTYYHISQLIDQNSQQQTYLWLSNVHKMSHDMFRVGAQYSLQRFYKNIQCLQDQNIYLYSGYYTGMLKDLQQVDYTSTDMLL